MERLRRLLLVTVGLVSVGLGVLGIFLPLLPTTPFLLLAAACFVRSSPRLHAWIMGHRVLGAFIRDWQDGRGLSARSKGVTLAVLWVTITSSGLVMYGRLGPTAPWFGSAAFLAVCAASVTLYLLFRVPTRR